VKHPYALLELLHGRYVHVGRVGVLARHIAALLPANASVLDVGCGDGLLALRLIELRPDITVRGVDVLVRPGAAIPVQAFDGTHLPLADKAVDVALCVDVLHHTLDPQPLLREMARVSSLVVVKDHTREGFLAQETLAFMDRLGNARHGVALPCNYLSLSEWHEVLQATGLGVEHWTASLPIYPAPASWIFGRRLHFLASLMPVSSRPPDPARSRD
jgi:SAM-dependent methyltransferase